MTKQGKHLAGSFAEGCLAPQHLPVGDPVFCWEIDDEQDR